MHSLKFIFIAAVVSLFLSFSQDAFSTTALPASAKVNEDSSVKITLTARGTGAITYTVYSNPSQGAVSINGRVATYTPNANYHGSDSFAFRATDRRGNSAVSTVSLSVLPVNDRPELQGAAYTTKRNTALVMDLVAQDIDGDTLTANVATAPSHGVVSFNGSLSATYTPDQGYVGEDSFSLAVTDNLSTSDPAAFNVTIESQKSGVVALAELQDIKINQLTGLVADGANISKVHNSCLSPDAVVAVGIQTSGVAVYKDGRLVVVPTSLSSDFSYKSLVCGESTAIVVTEWQLAKIDLDTLEQTAFLDLTGSGERIWFTIAAYSEERSRLIIQYLESATAVVYDSNTLAAVGEFSVSLANFFFKDDGTILVADASGILSQYDGNGTTLLSTRSIPAKSSSVALNPITNELWWFNSGNQDAKYLDLDGPNWNVKSVSGIVPSAKKITYHNGYVAIMCENCYDSGLDGTKMGGLSVIDANTHALLYTTPVMHEHASLDINDFLGVPSILLINNEHGSATLVDAASGSQELIDVSTMPEWVQIDKAGNLHLVNRLGGSSIVSLNPQTLEISELETELWPSGIGYDNETNQLMTFHLFGNSFGYFDVNPDDSIYLSENHIADLSGYAAEAEHDALGDLVYDPVHKAAFASIPENNQIAVHRAGGEIEIVTLPDYLGGVGYDELKGPGLITLAYDSQNQLLFVHLAAAGNKVLVLDDKNGLTQLSEIQAGISSETQYPLLIAGDRLYFGQHIFSLPDLTPQGRILYGQKVIAVDNDFGTYLTYEKDTSGSVVVYAIDSANQNLLAEFNVGNYGTDAPPAFTYDQQTGYLYAVFMEDALVKQMRVYE